MSMDLLVKFKINKEIYAMWKKGQATQKDSGSIELQGYNEESKGPLGTESGKGYQEQEGLLQFYQQQKIRENAVPLLNRWVLW